MYELFDKYAELNNYIKKILSDKHFNTNFVCFTYKTT